MKRKRKKVSVIVLLFLFTFWLVQAQRTMKFRETDIEAKKEFQTLGVTLITKTIYENRLVSS